MREDGRKLTVINTLEIIMILVSLLLFCLPQYFPTADAEFFYVAIVLPVTLVLEIIRWFKNKT